MNNRTLIVPNNYSAQVHLLELYIYEKLKRLSGQYIEDITPPNTLEECRYTLFRFKENPSINLNSSQSLSIKGNEQHTGILIKSEYFNKFVQKITQSTSSKKSIVRIDGRINTKRPENTILENIYSVWIAWGLINNRKRAQELKKHLSEHFQNRYGRDISHVRLGNTSLRMLEETLEIYAAMIKDSIVLVTSARAPLVNQKGNIIVAPELYFRNQESNVIHQSPYSIYSFDLSEFVEKIATNGGIIDSNDGWDGDESSIDDEDDEDDESLMMLTQSRRNIFRQADLKHISSLAGSKDIQLDTTKKGIVISKALIKNLQESTENGKQLILVQIEKPSISNPRATVIYKCSNTDLDKTNEEEKSLFIQFDANVTRAFNVYASANLDQEGDVEVGDKIFSRNLEFYTHLIKHSF